MFAGMVRLESSSTINADCEAPFYRCPVPLEGGQGTTGQGGISRKRSQRRPGYMRPEPIGQPDSSLGRAEREPCLSSKSSGPEAPTPRNASLESYAEQRSNLKPSECQVPLGKDKLVSCHQSERCSPQILTPHHPPRPQTGPRCQQGAGHGRGGSAQRECPKSPSPNNVFNSSFSFIQQSLEADENRDPTSHDNSLTLPASPTAFVLEDQNICKMLGSDQSKLVFDQAEQPLVESDKPLPQHGASIQLQACSAFTGQSAIGLLPAGPPMPPLPTTEQSEMYSQSGKPEIPLLGREHMRGDLDMPWVRDAFPSATSELRDCIPDSDSTEVTSSLSVDSSDTASASSVTSGYESATPASDQSWDGLMKKYEGFLKDCMQSNRTNTKIETMMLKLQRLQQKAVLEDDYDTAERFKKKLEELRVERATLKPGLPSRHPSVCAFLERLRASVKSALHRSEGDRENEELGGHQEGATSTQDPGPRRQRLLLEKQQVEEEIGVLQRRLGELQERSRVLEDLLCQGEQQQEVEEVEGTVLRASSGAQLRQLRRALEDMATSPHRAQICVSPPPAILRLQEQEQALGLSIREATAKVVLSQRLGGSLRRKVSESETQLLALHEAKLAAISGSDFGSAKELKAEMRAVCGERDRLDGLAQRLQALTAGGSQDLAHMKEQHTQLQQELEHRGAEHERHLKENTLKYIELLEDRLHSCGSPVLERIWEADLESCHLLLRTLQLRAPSCGGPETEELPPTPEPNAPAQPPVKEEADCAMLTALGGRWCPEANLQHSEFTKKLEEFLFCLEDSHSEDLGSDATELTEQCEMISDRLLNLEDQLQIAMLHQDQEQTLSLEKEVQEVKAILQALFSQLKEEEEEEGEDQETQEEEQYHDTEEGELEEDLYFSDSWEI